VRFQMAEVQKVDFEPQDAGDAGRRDFLRLPDRWGRQRHQPLRDDERAGVRLRPQAAQRRRRAAQPRPGHLRARVAGERTPKSALRCSPSRLSARARREPSTRVRSSS
jgi:hypothetical protein